MLTYTTLLAVSALVCRVLGISLRLAGPVVLRPLGWVIGVVATWLAAGAAGVFAPVWIALAAGLAGAWVGLRRPRTWWFAAADAALVVVLALASAPPLNGVRTALLVLLLGVAWGSLEVAVRWTGTRGTYALAVVAIVVAATLARGLRVDGHSGPLLPIRAMLPHLAVTSECEGRRVSLAGGTVGWLDVSGGGGEGGRGALLLHGYDRRGARQPTACVLRRSLTGAGFVTLAVDHPGLGESASPPADAPLEAWDPTSVHAEALDWLLERTGGRDVVVVGHSMGVTDALRLTVARPGDIESVFLFAGSVGDGGSEREDYWYRRFHAERGLQDSVPRDLWRRMQEVYHDPERVVRSLPTAHPPAVFVTLGLEWDNVRRGRDSLYRLIPGPKSRWHLEDFSHYLNAVLISGVLVGDARAPRQIAKGLRARLRLP